MRYLLALAIAVTGCDRVFGVDFGGVDAEVDATPPEIAPFSAPELISPNLATGAEEDDPSLTSDLLELYLLRSADLWVSKRGTTMDAWPIAERILELNTTATELRPSISGDGLTIYFARTVDGQRDIYFSTRSSRVEPWAEPEIVPLDLNQVSSHELPGWSSSDGLSLIVESRPLDADASDLYLATRDSKQDAFTSVPLEGINFVSHDGAGWFSDDLTRLVFESTRGGTSIDIWEAARFGDSWHVVPHPELDSTATFRSDGTPWLSPDGKIVVFSSNRSGTDDLYIATRDTP